MEAFRLFSLNTTVITDHMNKLAGYSSGELDPIFVIAYCDVSDFPKLCENYLLNISQQKYTGFTAPELYSSGDKHEVVVENAKLFTFEETRKFQGQSVTFLHCLLHLN